MPRNAGFLVLSLLAFALFALAGRFRAPAPIESEGTTFEDRVVISAPVLTALYAGDHYLAANLEVMRLAATGTTYGQTDMAYLVRAQRVAAELNPCHEDNYYLANGFLTWGGAESEATEVLDEAVACRFWDDIPAFFSGFNRFFFDRDVTAARNMLEVAAERTQTNAAGYRKLAIMLAVEKIEDERMALEFLQSERNQASDPKLIAMLDKRVVRLQGLVILREAQRRYETQGRQLETIEQLVEKGVIQAIPIDPLRLGYELKDGRIVLRQLKIVGMENSQ